MKHYISYKNIKSIYNWITIRNEGNIVLYDNTINKFGAVLTNGNSSKRYIIDLTKKEAEKIVEALYVNSHFEDSSVPQDEVKLLLRYI